MTALHDLTALEQRDAIRGGELTAKELAEHYLDRIERLDSRLGAFVTVTADLAREEAARTDAAMRTGDTGDSLLFGVPIGFKDEYAVAGVPVTMGTIAIGPVTSPTDGWSVGLLRQAGTVTLGTTHTPEFSASCFTDSHVVGRPAVTPYDTTRYAAGSSGGAAAAVAAGLLPVAHASDGAGSIRLPASVCGLVGLKPTRGRVSVAPRTSFQGWSTEGAITRTVEDTGLLLDVMANPPAGDLHRRPRAAGESFLAAAQTTPSRSLRIAVWTNSGLGHPSPAVAHAVHDTADRLSNCGHDLIAVSNPLPWNDHLVSTSLAVTGGVAAKFARTTISPDRFLELQDYTRWLVRLGRRRDAAAHVAATDELGDVASRFLEAVKTYDAVLTPATSTPPVPIGYFHEDGIDQCGRRMTEWSAFCPMANWTGLPAIVLPTHVSDDGLPIAVQLTATKHGDDTLLLSVSHQLEEIYQWHTRHPRQWFE
jgi:amidase